MRQDMETTNDVVPTRGDLKSLRIPDNYLENVGPESARVAFEEIDCLFRRCGVGYRIWYDECMCETVFEPEKAR